ncbi:acyltransferase family protein [Pseudomonas sp. TH15]|uniref:acyltransferase family protein n=1 Tax=Pseudomonas sp. TH15 TaxID=2796381 RepID=UPI0019146D2B|nr:acyltransferase [Pseudomonas sp. TH15]MBK5513196.1 acyltransferase [Pseudomonas sp. TH15]
MQDIPMPESMKGRIVFLDYMRVFAFVSVLIGHKFFEGVIALASNPENHIALRRLGELLIPLCEGGAAGVVVFFMTSGYIITHVLQSEVPADFLIKRFFRIYPLYVFAVIAEQFFGLAVYGTPLPELHVMLPRILLLGDFFGTPYSLAGVEWTLRIEVLFYVLMCFLKMAGAFRGQKILPVIYLALGVMLYYLPAFPTGYGWSDGYLSLYTSFLFMGSSIYLAQSRKIGVLACLLVCGALFFMFVDLITQLHPNWKENNYAFISILIFVFALLFRDRLVDSSLLRLLSNLTYSVYLFHNWLWAYILLPVEKLGFDGGSAKLITAIILLLVCYGLFETVEKFGLELGRRALKLKRKYFPIERLSTLPGR